MQKCLEQFEVENHLRNLRISGYTIIENFLTPTETETYLKRLVELHNEVSKISYDSKAPERGARDLMVYNLPNKNKGFIDLITCEAFEQILKPKLNDPYYRFLPNDVPNYVLTYYNGRSSGNFLDLHIDSYIPSPGEHTWVMQVVVALEDTNPENGCTVVVPGSHLSGKFTDRDYKGAVPLSMKKGSVAFWDSRLWHGTTENTSTRSRWALIGTFSAWWVKPAMDYTKSLPQEIYDQLTDKQKSLMGFCSIPPGNEFSGINTKKDYTFLKPRIGDYHV